jgi:membrane-bound metal-dependent hydrolase YbcI (DUF457 family)
MANYKGHLVGGVMACTGYIAVLLFVPGAVLAQTSGLLSNWQFVASLYIVAMLFGLWPDVDTNSKGQDIFFGLAFSVNVLLVFTGRFEAAAYLGLLSMLPIIGKHRGWTHSKVAMLLIPAPLFIIPYLNKSEVLPTMMVVYGAAVVGYFSHLLFDGLIIKKFRVKGN